MQEARPEESELRSEAQFQRVLAATLLSPGGAYFAPRAPSDRGRYPEEARDADADVLVSDDDDDDDAPPAVPMYEGIVVSKPSTPAASVCGDEMPMSVMESPGLSHMELDMVGFACVGGDVCIY
jgi:hypothetical protein